MTFTFNILTNEAEIHGKTVKITNASFHRIFILIQNPDFHVWHVGDQWYIEK